MSEVHDSVEDFIDDLRQIMREGHYGKIVLNCDGRRIGNYEKRSHHEPGDHSRGETELVESG